MRVTAKEILLALMAKIDAVRAEAPRYVIESMFLKSTVRNPGQPTGDEG